MAFPHTTRLHTYSPGSPVRSADLNAIQDAIIGNYDLIDVPMPVHDALEIDSGGNIATSGDWQTNTTDLQAAGTSTSFIYVPLNVTITSWVLSAVKVKYFTAASTTINIGLRLVRPNFDAATTAPTQDAGSDFSSPLDSAGAWAVASSTGSYTLEKGVSVFVIASRAGGSGVLKFAGAVATIRKPVP